MPDDSKPKDKVPTLPILELIKAHPNICSLAAYLWISALGFVYNTLLFYQFGIFDESEISLSDYYGASDFFLVALKNQQLVEVTAIILIYIFVIALLYIFFRKKLYECDELIDKLNNDLLSKEKQFNEEPFIKFLIKIKYRIRICSTKLIRELTNLSIKFCRLVVLLLFALPFYFSYQLAAKEATKIKDEDKKQAFVMFKTWAKPVEISLANKELYLIGKTRDFVFLYNKTEAKSVALPSSSVLAVLVENKQNKEFIKKILGQPVATDSKLADINKSLSTLEADHEEMKKDQCLHEKLTCCQPFGDRLLGKVYFDTGSHQLKKSMTIRN